MVIVRGSSFEDAKKHMETALQEQIERILREQLGRSAQGLLQTLVHLRRICPFAGAGRFGPRN
jgi:uncharacterized protein (DUF1697 family)